MSREVLLVNHFGQEAAQSPVEILIQKNLHSGMSERVLSSFFE
jgi:hypothetical protein